MYSVVLGGQRGNRSEGVHLLAWLHVRFTTHPNHKSTVNFPALPDFITLTCGWNELLFRFATHPNHKPTVNFPALPDFIMLTCGWNELLLATSLVNPDAGFVFRVTRLLADRSLGARFADVRLAIGFVSQWSGTPSPILSV